MNVIRSTDFATLEHSQRVRQACHSSFFCAFSRCLSPEAALRILAAYSGGNRPWRRAFHLCCLTNIMQNLQRRFTAMAQALFTPFTRQQASGIEATNAVDGLLNRLGDFLDRSQAKSRRGFTNNQRVYSPTKKTNGEYEPTPQ